MRRTALAIAGSSVVAAIGFAVAGLAASGSATGVVDSTSEGTTEETHESTTETPAPTKWAAALSARAEVPEPKGAKVGAAGVFTVTVTEKGAALSASYKLTFRNLTGKAVAAHIHRGKPGKAGPVLLALCGPCPSGKRGSASLSPAALSAMKAGAAYVNVHTAKNTGGELRGQLKRVP